MVFSCFFKLAGRGCGESDGGFCWEGSGCFLSLDFVIVFFRGWRVGVGFRGVVGSRFIVLGLNGVNVVWLGFY